MSMFTVVSAMFILKIPSVFGCEENLPTNLFPRHPFSTPGKHQKTVRTQFE